MNQRSVALIALLMASSGVAFAQEVVEGPGIAVSPGTVIHPGVGAEMGVVNNVFYEATSPITSALLRISAKFAIASTKIDDGEAEEPLPGEAPLNEPAAPLVEFRAGLGAAYEEYLHYDNRSTEDQRNLSFDAVAHAIVLPRGIWAFVVDERLLRSPQSRHFEDPTQTDRWANWLSLGVRFQPGGRALSGTISYKNALEVYEDTPIANRMNHTFSLRGDWQWRPFTKFFADISYGLFGPLGDAGLLEKSSSTPLTFVAGVATVLTEPLTVKLHGGWGWAPYEMGPGYNAPLVNAEIGYAYAPTGRVILEAGYYFEDSTNANFFRDAKFAARVDQQIDRLVLQASAAVYLRKYDGIPATVGPPERNDVIFGATVGAQYAATERYVLTAQYVATIDSTDYVSMFAGFPDDPSYTRQVFLAGARAAF
jgi:hypothetical protein